jgi:hypothetical protein
MLQDLSVDRSGRLGPRKETKGEEGRRGEQGERDPHATGNLVRPVLVFLYASPQPQALGVMSSRRACNPQP